MRIYDNHLRIRTVAHILRAAGLTHGKIETFTSQLRGYRDVVIHIEPSADREPYIEALVGLPWTDKRITADANAYVVVAVPTIQPVFLPVPGDVGDRIRYEDVQPGDLICVPDQVTPGVPGVALFGAVFKSWMAPQQVHHIEHRGTGETAHWVITWAHNPQHDGDDLQYVSRIERYEVPFGARLIARFGAQFGEDFAPEFATLDARA